MTIIESKDVSVKINTQTVLKKLCFTVLKGEQWAIVGPSGSGKTTLLETLKGRHYYTGNLHLANQLKVVYVEQQHHIKNLSNTADFYYQQRYNSFDSEDSVTVEQHLYAQQAAFDNSFDTESVNKMIQQFGLMGLLNTKLIQLSNGENKRLQLALALLKKPHLLLLDNPYLGIDVAAREKFTSLFKEIIRTDVQIIMVTTPHQIPDFITHVLKIEPDGTARVLPGNSKMEIDNHLQDRFDVALFKKLTGQDENDFEQAIKMVNVSIKYGDKQVLQNIHWQVNKGERWVLSGANGAGKSTLLSLINADNPQAYANEIYLFDKRRGRGESIWDIKKRIGFISPEMHLYFESGITVFDVVASGLFDTIGLFRKLSIQQQNRVEEWLKLMQVSHLRNKLLKHLPNSQQRLILIVRALIKNPSLLIFDEPTQGLDEEQLLFFNSIISQLCTYTNKTIIYVSHYREDIPACINKCIELEEGKIKMIKS